MKKTKSHPSNFRTLHLSVLCYLLLFSCAGTVENHASLLKYKTEKSKIHEDSVSMRAETLPEFRVDPHDKEFQRNQISGVVRTIFQDKKGNFWFGTNGGAYIYDGKTLNTICKKDGLITDFVHQIIEDSKGNYWISTSKGIFEYDGRSLINRSEGLYKIDEGVGCILEDNNGTIWFIANRRDIYSYKDQKFTKIHIEVGNNGPLPFQIYEDQQDRLWLVGFKGAYRYDNARFVNINRDGPW